MTSRSLFFAACAFLLILSASTTAQKPDKPPETTAQPPLSLNNTAHGKRLSTRVGQEIIVTLQTIGPGHYESPRVSSASVRFTRSSFPQRQNPGGPTQIFRFLSFSAGEAKIEIPHTQPKPAFQLTIQVNPN